MRVMLKRSPCNSASRIATASVTNVADVAANAAKRKEQAIMRKSVFVGAMLAAVLLVASTSHAQERVPVYLQNGAGADGFTDPSKARTDSLKDLAKQLRDSKVVRITDAPADAVVTLEVLARETHRDVTLMWGVQNKSGLTVRLTAGDYTTEFSAESGSHGLLTGYGDAAKKIVKQFEGGVKANHERLSASALAAQR